MNSTRTNNKNISSLTIWFSFALVFMVINILFLTFIDSSAKTITQLNKETLQLKQQERLIATAKDLTTKYQQEMALVSAVFPEEKTISQFIQTLESQVASYSAEYSVKFNSVTPLKEQDRLFLPLSITLRSDLETLTGFFASLEQLPYMTHITGISVKSPDGILNKSEMVISLKIYVKDPFTE